MSEVQVLSGSIFAGHHLTKEDGSMYEYLCKFDRRYYYADDLKSIADRIVQDNEKNSRTVKSFKPEKLNENKQYEMMTKSSRGYDINTLEPIVKYAPRESSPLKFYANYNGEDFYGNSVRAIITKLESSIDGKAFVDIYEYEKETKIYCISYGRVLINFELEKNKYYIIKLINDKKMKCHILGTSNLCKCRCSDIKAPCKNGGDVYIIETKSGICIINKYSISNVKEISDIEYID